MSVSFRMAVRADVPAVVALLADDTLGATREGADALEHRTEGAKILRSLNDRLAPTGYLYNDNFSLLDAAILPFVRQFRIPDKDWFDAQDWPHLHKWLQDFLASGRFQTVMHKYPVWDGGETIETFPAA